MEKKQATLSPSIHEKTVERHFVRDQDDPVLTGLHAATKAMRETCERAAKMRDQVLANTLKTEAARHRQARMVSFEMLKKATEVVDEAVKAAQAEIGLLRSRCSGPAPVKDTIAEMRQRELRDKFAALPEERRRMVVAEADEAVVAALLAVPPWVVGMTTADLDMVRNAWARRRHPADLDRVARLEAALEDVKRAGSLGVTFVDELTNEKLVSEAERLEAAADAALREAKQA